MAAIERTEGDALQHRWATSLGSRVRRSGNDHDQYLLAARVFDAVFTPGWEIDEVPLLDGAWPLGEVHDALSFQDGVHLLRIMEFEGDGDVGWHLENHHTHVVGRRFQIHRVHHLLRRGFEGVEEDRQGVDAVAIALSWVLQQPFSTFPLFGAQRPRELWRALAAFGFELANEDCHWLEGSDAKTRSY